MARRESLLAVFFLLPLIACPGSASTGTAPPAEQPTPAATAASPTAALGASFGFYDIGSPRLADLYVSPTGNDSDSGTSRDAPLQTLGAAWGRIPLDPLSGTGYRINLLPGQYPCEGDCSNFFADRSGTYDFPIILRAADGPQTATLLGGLNLQNVRYLYLMDLTLWAGNEAGSAFGNNALHVEKGDHVLLRRLTIRGPQACLRDDCNDIQEVLKANQSEFIYVEECDLSGAYQTALDFVSVQHGHILRSRIHRSGGRCAYLKGGSAYFVVAGNEFSDCSEAGFQAGESTNLAFMGSPWLHYETYDVKVVSNVIHDVYGAGLAVHGGYNILLAYNTLYRIGLDDDQGRNWTLLRLGHGGRSCIAADELGGSAGTRARCQQLLDLGGWGTAALGEDNGGFWIPNRNVYVYNNIFYNPAGSGTHYAQLAINGPVTPPGHTRHIPNPSRTDDHVVIRGNLIWNIPQEGDLLVDSSDGSEPGCHDASCNSVKLAADNTINRFEPNLIDPAHGNWQPTTDGNVFQATTYAMPDFAWSDAPTPPPVPAGVLSNAVTADYAGRPRRGSNPPGAFAAPLPRTVQIPLALYQTGMPRAVLQVAR